MAFTTETRLIRQPSPPRVAFGNVPDAVPASGRPGQVEVIGAMLAGLTPAQPTFADDLGTFTRAVTDVAEAARDGILTQPEADALIGAIAAQFGSRRVAETLAGIGRVGLSTRVSEA